MSYRLGTLLNNLVVPSALSSKIDPLPSDSPQKSVDSPMLTTSISRKFSLSSRTRASHSSTTIESIASSSTSSSARDETAIKRSNSRKGAGSSTSSLTASRRSGRHSPPSMYDIGLAGTLGKPKKPKPLIVLVPQESTKKPKTKKPSRSPQLIAATPPIPFVERRVSATSTENNYRTRSPSLPSSRTITPITERTGLPTIPTSATHDDTQLSLDTPSELDSAVSFTDADRSSTLHIVKLPSRSPSSFLSDSGDEEDEDDDDDDRMVYRRRNVSFADENQDEIQVVPRRTVSVGDEIEEVPRSPQEQAPPHFPPQSELSSSPEDLPILTRAQQNQRRLAKLHKTFGEVVPEEHADVPPPVPPKEQSSSLPQLVIPNGSFRRRPRQRTTSGGLAPIEESVLDRQSLRSSIYSDTETLSPLVCKRNSAVQSGPESDSCTDTVSEVESLATPVFLRPYSSRRKRREQIGSPVNSDFESSETEFAVSPTIPADRIALDRPPVILKTVIPRKEEEKVRRLAEGPAYRANSPTSTKLRLQPSPITTLDTLEKRIRHPLFGGGGLHTRTRSVPGTETPQSKMMLSSLTDGRMTSPDDEDDVNWEGHTEWVGYEDSERLMKQLRKLK